MTEQRTKDTYQKQIYDFIKDIYVVCPKCENKAIVKTDEILFRNIDENKIKLICANCGFNKRLEEIPTGIQFNPNSENIISRYFVIGGTIDPYFHQQLWLTSKCGENVLWAYNYEHLAFLERHVEAKLRERNIESIENKSIEPNSLSHDTVTRHTSEAPKNVSQTHHETRKSVAYLAEY